jgi:Holliday junction resolvasome RuvABC endonuclease subunit
MVILECVKTIMGVDASSTRLAMVVLKGDRAYTEIKTLPSDVAEACWTASAWLKVQLEEYSPSLIVVEAPFFHRLHPSGSVPMSQVNGALLAGTEGYRVISVQPSHWKKSVLGVGNANKEAIGQWVKQNHTLMFETLDPMKYREDLIDAFCIALHGRKVLESRAKLLHRSKR